MNQLAIKTCARNTAIFSLTGLGFTLPISSAGANIMLLLTIIGWLGSGQWQQKWRVLKDAPAAHGVGLFFGVVLVGLLYGDQSYATHYLSKYASLLLLPVVLTLQLSPKEKQQALVAFCAAMTLTLLLSILIWLDLLPATLFNQNGQADNPIVFKLHITHGFFMVLAAFCVYMAAQQYPTSPRRLVLLIVVLLALINALLMIKGRTGQIVLAALLVYLFHLRFPRYGLLIGVAATLALAAVAYSTSPAFKERADIAVAEATQWEQRRGDPSSSIGTRLDYYSTTIAIIQDNPVIGVGTGGFSHAYDAKIEGTVLQPSNNPHNQYLLVSAQYGLIGLTLLILLYFNCWRQIRLSPQPWAQIAVGILIAYLLGNLFNSFMLDFSERIFFAWAMGVLLSPARETST